MAAQGSLRSEKFHRASHFGPRRRLGKWDNAAPAVARSRYKLDIVELGYDELAARLKSLMADAQWQTRTAAWTDRCLAMPNTKLETKREFVERAFYLYVVIRQWLREHKRRPSLSPRAWERFSPSPTRPLACR